MAGSVEEKKALRKRTLAARDAILPEARQRDSRRIVERLVRLPEFENAGRVALFASFRSEVNLDGAFEIAIASGKEVALPLTILDARRLEFHVVGSLAELVTGAYGIREPDPDRHAAAPYDTLDLVVAPGAAFDGAGRRMGYGGGFYDAVIEGLRPGVPVIGVCFDEQVVDRVPTEPHDKPVDAFVTPTRTVTVDEK